MVFWPVFEFCSRKHPFKPSGPDRTSLTKPETRSFNRDTVSSVSRRMLLLHHLRICCRLQFFVIPHRFQSYTQAHLGKPLRTSRKKPVGLAAVAHGILGRTMNKSCQCSNWELRPLTRDQMASVVFVNFCVFFLWKALKSFHFHCLPALHFACRKRNQ